MLCISVYEQQDEFYKQFVLLVEVGVCIVIEVVYVDYWYKYVGFDGCIIGMISFGELVLVLVLFEYFGFILDNVLVVVEELLED